MARAYADEVDEERSQQALASICFFKYIVLICRVFGFVTFIALMSVGIHTIIVYANEEKNTNGGPRNLDVGIYIICAALFLFILETSWLFYRLLKCCQQKKFCHYIFLAILWVDVYKRGLVYFVMALPCFLQGIELPLGLLCGLLLCIVALLYIAKTYKRFGEEYALSQLTGKASAKAPPDSTEYTKLLQSTVNSVATQTSSAEQSEEEEEEETEVGAPDDATTTAPKSSKPERPAAPPSISGDSFRSTAGVGAGGGSEGGGGGVSGGGVDSPFASIKSLGKKKKSKKEKEERPSIEVTLETDLEGGNPFGDYDEGFD